MNLIEVFERFPEHVDCIDYLEAIRWSDGVHCPHCDSSDVARKGEIHRWGRWNCHSCKSSFTVMSKTMFQYTKIPLQKWFAGICLVVNAKKSISSYQLARDLEMKQKAAWYMLTRIRAEMAKKEDVLLQGIIEADETYIGGKPRRRKDKDGNLPPASKRGRGTKKTPVIGVVERDGNVKAQVATDLSHASIRDFINDSVNVNESILMTDEFRSYQAIEDIMEHNVIKHKEKQYVDGDVHTNTIEGFWSLLKRAWYGSHHHYRKRYIGLYVAEACFKYNNRENPNIFSDFLKMCMT